MITDLIQKIALSSKEHKPKPFFTFNDKMNVRLLENQIKTMSEVGIGGFFIHARSGLVDEYLSDDWFDIVKKSIDCANKYELDVYIYDEHGWPSGFAGGKHLGNKKDYWVKWLECKKIDCIEEAKYIQNILRIYGVDEKNVVHPITDSKDIYSFFYVVYYVTNSGYIDVLNEEAVRSFMESTYVEYHKRFPNKFKGFFTDEPLYGDRRNPWNFTLNQRFLERFGYNLTDKLVSLFIDIGDYKSIRYDYFTLVNEMFNTAYFKQLYDFCLKNGYELTGHGIEESAPSLQVKCSADLMSKYEYMTIPGMDWLGKSIGSPVLPKQVSSVAVQLSKKATISEMYALTGWAASLSELKRIGEWQYVHGISNICYILQHSMRGIRKRDYPSGYILQQPYLGISQEFNSTFANLGAIIEEGKEECNVLLLLPVESVYTEYNGDINQKTSEIDNSYVDLSSALSQSHIPYHIGNENIMKEHGKINGNRIHIGFADYGYVILPTLTTIKRSTLELLCSFIENKGKVLTLGTLPCLCEGLPCNELTYLKEHCLKIFDEKELVDYLVSNGLQEVRITRNDSTCKEIYSTIKVLEGYQILYMVNHTKEQLSNVQISLNQKGSIVRLDLNNLKKEQVFHESLNDNINWSLNFAPMESYAFVISKEEQEFAPQKQKKIRNISITDRWEIKACSDNCLVLDACEYIVDGVDYPKDAVIRVFKKLMELRKDSNVKLRFTFKIKQIPPDSIYLAMEESKRYRIKVNGEDFNGLHSEDSFIYEHNKKIDITKALTVGENIIELDTLFTQSPKTFRAVLDKDVLETEKNVVYNDTELENIYIVGNFGVYSLDLQYQDECYETLGEFYIAKAPTFLSSSNLVAEGFPFFAGKLELENRFEIKQVEDSLYMVSLQTFGCAVNIKINSKELGDFLWETNSINLSKFIKSGENAMSCTLHSNLRNIFGPHHNKNCNPDFVGFSTFTDTPDWCDPPSCDFWSDNYTFMRFGIKIV